MKRIFPSLLVLTTALLLPSCAKFAEGNPPYDDKAIDECSLFISGTVMDYDTQTPLQDIEATLKSFQPSDELLENPVATETVTTSSIGTYIIRKRLNQPAYSLKHVVFFADIDKEENGGFYRPFQKEISVPQDGLSGTPNGYIFEFIDIYLSKFDQN